MSRPFTRLSDFGSESSMLLLFYTHILGKVCKQEAELMSEDGAHGMATNSTDSDPEVIKWTF